MFALKIHRRIFLALGFLKDRISSLAQLRAVAETQRMKQVKGFHFFYLG